MDKWGVIGLAWGDTMASLSVAKELGVNQIIYIGPYSSIATFISNQDFIKSVKYRTYDYDRRYEYIKYFTRMANQLEVDDQLDFIYHEFKLDSICEKSQLVSCQCDWTATKHTIQVPSDLKINEEAKKEALSLLNGLTNYTLIQSQSLHTNKDNAHWPHWNELLEHVINNDQDRKIVLVGEFPDEDYKSDNILDLRGKTSTAEVLFYLAELAHLTITVPNSVYHWCNLKNLNAINICHNSFHLCNPFYRMINSLNCKDVFHKDGLEKAIYWYENQDTRIVENYNVSEFLPKNIYLKQYDLKTKLNDPNLQTVDLMFEKLRNHNWCIFEDFPIQYVWNGLKYIPEENKNIYPSYKLFAEIENIINLFNQKYVDCKRNIELEKNAVFFCKFGNLLLLEESLPYIHTVCAINYNYNQNIKKIMDQYFDIDPLSTEKVKLYINKFQLQEE
jgi:hypothetical protein